MTDAGRPSVEVRLREIVTEDYRLLRSTDGRTFGAHRDRPARALLHAASDSPLLRDASLRFVQRHQRMPSTSAVAAVSSYLAARADELEPVPVPVRSWWARAERAVYIDVCDEHGTVLRVDERGPAVAREVPVTFRRASGLTALPWVSTSGSAEDLEALWSLARVAEQDRAVALGAMLSAHLTDTAQPVVLLTGTQDSGKTSTARFLLSVVDPTSQERGGDLPGDAREWKARVGRSRVVLIDNLSWIKPEASDLLCRVATGGELISRTLYSDDEAHVSNLHVPVWLTSIDPGVLRGDLASRIVSIELEPIGEHERLPDSTLRARQDAVRVIVTRGLLWLLGAVLEVWDDVGEDNLPHRAGDFARVVRCVDKIMGTCGEDRLRASNRDLAEDVVDGNPVAAAVRDWSNDHPGGPHERTAGTLLEELGKQTDVFKIGRMSDRGWPRTAAMLGSSLRRVAPALRQAHGIDVEFAKSNGKKIIRITGRRAGSA